MGSSLPNALTLPCREGELQRATENPLWPSSCALGEERECGWGEGPRLEPAQLGSLSLSWGGGKEDCQGHIRIARRQLADIFIVCPELRPCEEQAKVESAVSAATSLRKDGKMGQPLLMALVVWAEALQGPRLAPEEARCP